MKTARQRINRETKLPIYNKPVEYRINNLYKELIGISKTQANKGLASNNLSEALKNQVKELMYGCKLAGINSSLNSSYLPNIQF